MVARGARRMRSYIIMWKTAGEMAEWPKAAVC
jgi:hypothetical protein